MPDRVQLSRAKGWRMPPNTVKVDRRTEWGNPWAVGKRAFDGRVAADRAEAVAMFRAMLNDYDKRDSAGFPDDEEIISGLSGKNLACWCPPGSPCHADVLLEVANA